ncbi:MAG: class I SAM-dependent rRNA methyltransferase [Sphaerochaetaceae bacterium]|nr:class I SAM-dependent rRNA methyltransferase [Sphaerochaetaceae bacterium]MDD3365985.1 class I SAM-dependent rRNA methyltransferase [Sphaerochaetaceae bacterium]
MYTALASIRIREGKEKQLVRHHPWVFSGAISKTPKNGLEKQPAVVRVEAASGAFIAYGWYDERSHIPIRLLSWDSAQIPDQSWWIDTLTKAVQRRQLLFNTLSQTNAFRLVHGEADFLPGITVDVFASTIVCIISARVAWFHRLLIVQTLQQLLNPTVIVVATDSAFCGIEQLKEVVEYYVDGQIKPTMPNNSEINFLENDLLYTMALGAGQKSGFYCDQRENRARLANYAQGREVLDVFCYTGGFSYNALKWGAQSITAVDSSETALERLASQLQANISQGKVPSDSAKRLQRIKADVFQYLRNMDQDRYDLIILDPPKLAQTKSQVPNALRAYKDLNRLAIQKIRKNGIIMSFSCSGGVSREQFQTAIAWAAIDAKREVQILETLGQPSDHPIRTSFPESKYLKGFIFTII